jgi:hypothetical protein
MLLACAHCDVALGSCRQTRYAFAPGQSTVAALPQGDVHALTRMRRKPLARTRRGHKQSAHAAQLRCAHLPRAAKTAQKRNKNAPAVVVGPVVTLSRARRVVREHRARHHVLDAPPPRGRGRRLRGEHLADLVHSVEVAYFGRAAADAAAPRASEHKHLRAMCAPHASHALRVKGNSRLKQPDKGCVGAQTLCVLPIRCSPGAAAAVVPAWHRVHTCSTNKCAQREGPHVSACERG